MLKFVYSLISMILIVMLLILYFQNIASTGRFDYFESYLGANGFMINIILFSFLAGVFLTLAVKSFLSSSKDVSDEFDL